MRATPALLPLLALLGQGCLYIGGINEPPRAELAIAVGEKPIKGTTVEFRATLRDAEDGSALSPTWTVRDMLAGGIELADCDYTLRALPGLPGRPSAKIQFLRT